MFSVLQSRCNTAASSSTSRQSSRPACIEPLEKRSLLSATLYAADSSTSLFKVDTGTGQTHVVGNMGVTMYDIAMNANGDLYGVDGGSALYRINPTTCATTRLGSLGFQVTGLAFSKTGTLYAASNSLYSINVLNGAPLRVGSFGGAFCEGDIAFDAAGRLFLSTTGGSLAQIDVATGKATTLGSIGFSQTLGLASGTDGVMYGMSNATRQIFSLNLVTGHGTAVSSFSGVNGVFGAASAPVITPVISKLTPPLVSGRSSPQPLTIAGGNFQQGCTVTLRDLTAGKTYTKRTILAETSTHLTIYPNFGTSAHSWSVEVINPGNASSGQYKFKVVAPGALPFGTVLGSFNGVTAYSNSAVGFDSKTYNHDPISGKNTGLKWQCVEFVNRYYAEHYGVDIQHLALDKGGWNATSFFGNLKKDSRFTTFGNGSTSAPKEGDILCFSDGTGPGHVAIVREVLPAAGIITVIQQNVTESYRDANFAYTYTLVNGGYVISGANISVPGSTYTVQGWVRLKA